VILPHAIDHQLPEGLSMLLASPMRRFITVLTCALATPCLAQAPSQSGSAKTGDAKIWENYDFVPGNRVIFFTDFSEDRVGNFARGLKYASGAAEVVERGGTKVLRSTNSAQFFIPVGKKLPARFTLEIDAIVNDPDARVVLRVEGGPEEDRGDKSAELSWDVTGAMLLGSGQSASSTVKVPEEWSARILGQVAHIRVLMDSAYFKMYTNERRFYNVPNLQFRRDSVIRVSITGSDEKPIFLTSIRVAESSTAVLYNALTSNGRWVTQGILFATGKSDIQAESRPVLQEIASTLTKHADLKILIEGHTDNVGSAPANLALSTARAAAVKAALVSAYGIAAGRVMTKGLGDTKPAAPNTSAAGRAQNRRVEIVKQ